MLIVTGEIEIDPAAAEALRAAALPMMEATAREPGCRFYRFYQDVGRPGVFRVYEEWESQADLDAHMTTPHMAEWRRALGEIGVRRRQVRILSGATVREL